jgi:hypothetical protein
LFAGLCGCLLLAVAGCGKARMVRAPTSVGPEDPEQPVVRVARASPEAEPPSRSTDPPAQPEAFTFPADRGGELLSKELTPARPLPEPAAKPRRFKVSPSLEAPELPLPPSLAGHAAPPPERPRKPPLPRLITPEAMTGLTLEVALPKAQPMPVGVRAKEVGPDVNKPAPLPILGQQVPDRASLADATTEASAAAMLQATMPVRQRAVPFLRLTIPDPFENYRPLRLPLLPESTQPVTASPRTPQR